MIDKLSAPFPADVVQWRVGSVTKDKAKGMALAYIDSRDVMKRLDDVCGPAGWQDDFVPMPNGTTCCRIGILIDGQWVWKGDGAGATGNVENDAEREMAQKGGYSDAFKRAAVKWGIGRYLYDLDSPWVELDEYKRIKKTEYAKLKAALQRNGQPQVSSAKAKAEDQWKEMIAGLNAAIQVNDVAGFLNQPNTIETVARWPDKWREAWDEKVMQAERVAA